MFEFDNIKNDITSQSNNIANTIALNTFNPIVTFFNFYGEYLPYIKEDTNYNYLVHGGIYRLDIADFDNTIKLGDKHYTITPYKFSYNICIPSSDDCKLFKSENFESYNLTEVDSTFNILYNNILILKYKDYISKVAVKYFDLFAIYILYFKDCKITPIIYLSYRPDIEISELLKYIYKIYDLSSYSEINNEIQLCNFDYYNSYYKYICEREKMKPELDSLFNDIRRGSIVYFKYNGEHYFINRCSYLTTLNDLLLFEFQQNLHYKENNFTYVYIINNNDPFSEMKFMHVTSPCELPEFCKYILRGKLAFYYNDSYTIIKVKLEK